MTCLQKEGVTCTELQGPCPYPSVLDQKQAAPEGIEHQNLQEALFHMLQTASPDGVFVPIKDLQRACIRWAALTYADKPLIASLVTEVPHPRAEGSYPPLKYHPNTQQRAYFTRWIHTLVDHTDETPSFAQIRKLLANTALRILEEQDPQFLRHTKNIFGMGKSYIKSLAVAKDQLELTVGQEELLQQFLLGWDMRNFDFPSCSSAIVDEMVEHFAGDREKARKALKMTEAAFGRYVGKWMPQLEKIEEVERMQARDEAILYAWTQFINAHRTEIDQILPLDQLRSLYFQIVLQHSKGSLNMWCELSGLDDSPQHRSLFQRLRERFNNE